MVITEALGVKTSPRKSVQRLNLGKCPDVWPGWRSSSRKETEAHTVLEVKGRSVKTKTEAVASSNTAEKPKDQIKERLPGHQ